MRILHLNTTDSGGGAAIACNRLHASLLAKGIDSIIMCHRRSGCVPNVVELQKPNRVNNLYHRVVNRLAFQVTRPPLFHEPDCHSSFSLNISKNRLVDAVRQMKPDILHLHWVGRGFLRIEDLRILAMEFPVVWTLHDMWPFCGGEHYAYNDMRWRNGYFRKNRNSDAKGPDWNRWVWLRKERAWEGLTIHTIAVSQWINSCLQESRLFRKILGNRTIIFNGLDTDIFHPKELVKGAYNTPRNGRPWRILFGAVSQSNHIKGGDMLTAALEILEDILDREIEITTFGKESLVGNSKIPHRNFGQIRKPENLAELYASSDITVVPSRLESFGQVAAESSACGTPVVTYDTSGLRDIVEHKLNGYRAKCYSPYDLANGIKWCLENERRNVSLRFNARKIAKERFDNKIIANKTIKFYKSIL